MYVTYSIRACADTKIAELEMLMRSNRVNTTRLVQLLEENGISVQEIALKGILQGDEKYCNQIDEVLNQVKTILTN